MEEYVTKDNEFWLEKGMVRLCCRKTLKIWNQCLWWMKLSPWASPWVWKSLIMTLRGYLSIKRQNPPLGKNTFMRCTSKKGDKFLQRRRNIRRPFPLKQLRNSSSIGLKQFIVEWWHSDKAMINRSINILGYFCKIHKNWHHQMPERCFSTMKKPFKLHHSTNDDIKKKREREYQ